MTEWLQRLRYRTLSLDLAEDMLAIGDEVRIEGEVPPLLDAGQYLLRFDLVAEGVSWFADHGTMPYAVPIEVTP